MTQKTVRRCAHCGHGANKRQGPLHFVEQQNAKYHYGCMEAAQEAQEKAEREAARIRSCPRAFSGGHLFALGEERCPTCGWSRTLKRVTTRAEHLDAVVEVDVDGKPTRVTVTAGSAETVTPTLGKPLRPPASLKRGSLAMVGAEYEPGNGTRYDLLVLNAQGAKPLLVWTNGPGGGRSMFVPMPGVAVSYIAEKLGCNTADAEAIAMFLRHAT